MSLEMYLGFITGNILAVIAVAIGMKVKRSKGQVEEDERTALIRAKTGGTAFYLSLVAVYIAWAAENIVKGMNGEAIHLFTPLGVVFAVMVAIWLASYLFYNRQVTADGEMTETERKKQLQKGIIMAGMAVVMSSLQGVRGDRNVADAQARLLLLQGVRLARAVVLIVKPRKKTAN